MSRIEKGERKAPQLLRKCLLGRMQILNENFVEYLQPQEYETWLLRQNIIYDLSMGNIESAEIEISEYESRIDADDNISLQFFYFTQMQLQLSKGKNLRDIYELSLKTVECSMKHLIEDFDGKLPNALLAVHEYCVLIEQIAASIELQALNGDNCLIRSFSRLKAVMDKCEKEVINIDEKALIYAMAAFYFCKEARLFLIPGNPSCEKESKTICIKALSFLHEARKDSYMAELMDELRVNASLDSEEKKQLKEYEDCWDELTKLYEEYGVSAYMPNDAIAFRETSAYAIGDIILRRRKLLGMRQKDLCKGVCVEKTLSRLESGKCDIQDYTFKAIFTRLNLVSDYMHGEIIADSRDAFELYKKVKKLSNEKDYENLQNCIAKLEKTVNMDLSYNRQCINRLRYNCELMGGTISEEEYLEKIKELLKITIPNIDGTKAKEAYFNDTEIMLLHNMALKDEKKRTEYLKLIFTAIDNGYAKTDFITQYNLYAFILYLYASEQGNKGEYAISDSISDNIIRAGLCIRNVEYLARNIYNKYWNASKQGHAQIDKLVTCLRLSEYCQSSREASYYSGKINSIKHDR
ncbi:MAG: hypothetical protein J5717_11295 [Lachnospiraceae bacterium]|nr:hypothetical protein [Lachnospiraceae bacterium]